MSSVRVNFQIGHKASIRTKATPEGFTHDWEVYVRGSDTHEISSFVDKVVFHLHETFPKPKRVVKEPPFSVKESGYAGFVIPIEVYLKNKDEPKKIKFQYDLVLHQTGPDTYNFLNEQYVFHNPNEDFRRKLLKGGGFVPNHNTSYSSHEEKSRDSFTDERSQLVSKPKLSGELKKHKVKEHKYDGPKPTNSFVNLFGPPIQKTSKVSPDPKKVAPPPPVTAKVDKKEEKKSDKEKSKKHEHKDKEKKKEDKDKYKEEKARKEAEKAKEKSNKRLSERPSSPPKKKCPSPPRRAPSPPPKPIPAKEDPKPQKPPEPEKKKESEPKAEKEKKSKKDKKEKSHDKEKTSKEKDRERKKDKEHKSKDKEAHKAKEIPKEISKPKEQEKERDKPIQPPAPAKETPKKEKPFNKFSLANLVKDPEPPKDDKKSEDRKHKHKKKDKKRDDSREKNKEKKHRHDRSSKDTPLEPKEPPPPEPALEPEETPIKDEPISPISLDSHSSIEKRAKPAESATSDSESDSESGSDDDTKCNRKSAEPPKPPKVDVKQEIPPTKEEEAGPSKAKKHRERKNEDDDKKKRKRKVSIKEEREEQPERKIIKTEAPKASGSRSVKSETKLQDNGVSSSLGEAEEISDTGELSPDYLLRLKQLQQRIMTIKSNEELIQVVNLIAETGRYEITTQTFDFDLCLLDKSTVQKLIELIGG